MEPSNKVFVAPNWLRCVCCCAGMLPLFPAIAVEARWPSAPAAASVVVLSFLFRFCLCTLINGVPPKSAIEFAADWNKGKFSAKERNSS